jgi:hypothetical protein
MLSACSVCTVNSAYSVAAKVVYAASTCRSKVPREHSEAIRNTNGPS